MIFDSHAHYDDAKFDEDRETVIEGLKSSGIELVMDVGASRASTEAAAALADRYDFFYAAAGVHPADTGEFEDGTADMAWLKSMFGRPKVKALGEIGLDYHWPEDTDRTVQSKWFCGQLELAVELDAPVIIHSRDAAEDTFNIMKELGGDRICAVIHCFSYEKEMAKRFLDLGYMLGIGGVLTYNNARKLREVVEYMPLEAMLIETDCPYLTPMPHRGKRNISTYLPLVTGEAAAIKGISREELEAVVFENTMKFYRI